MEGGKNWYVTFCNIKITAWPLRCAPFHALCAVLPASCTFSTALVISAFKASVSSADTEAVTGTTANTLQNKQFSIFRDIFTRYIVKIQQIDKNLKSQLLTCQLSNCTICQGGDYIFWGDSYYVELVFRCGCFRARVYHLLRAFTSYHQAFHPGFAVVDSLDVGAQVVHAIEASATFVTQERFFSWNRDKDNTNMMRKASPFCK